MERAKFDEMLLDHAAETGRDRLAGSQRHRGALGAGGDRRPARAPRGVVVQRKGRGARAGSSAKVVVDATGTNALISKKLDIREARPACCARRPSSPTTRTARATPARTAAPRWSSPPRPTTAGSGTSPWPTTSPASAWSATWIASITNRTGTPEQILDEEIANCAGLDGRMNDATRCGPVHVLSRLLLPRHPLRRRRLGAGRRRLRLPRPDVLLRRVPGPQERARWPPTRSTRPSPANDFSAAQLSKWGDPLSEGMQTIRKLVYAFYTQGLQLRPVHQGLSRTHRDDVTAVLIGDVFRPGGEEVFEPHGHDGPGPAEHPAGEAEGGEKEMMNAG